MRIAQRGVVSRPLSHIIFIPIEHAVGLNLLLLNGLLPTRNLRTFHLWCRQISQWLNPCGLEEEIADSRFVYRLIQLSEISNSSDGFTI